MERRHDESAFQFGDVAPTEAALLDEGVEREVLRLPQRLNTPSDGSGELVRHRAVT
jgi:hypothetical protein